MLDVGVHKLAMESNRRLFLTNRLNTQEKANSINIVLSYYHDTDICIKTLTFDGSTANISMATHLGANLVIPNIKTYFLNPQTK